MKTILVRSLLAISGLTLLVTGFTGCTSNVRQELKLHSIPEPIANSVPYWFTVVAYDNHHIAKALVNGYATENFTSSQSFIWNSEITNIGPYTALIEPKDLDYATKQASKTLPTSPASIELELLITKSGTHTQRYKCTYYSDDFTYYSIYEVKNGKVVPFAFGDTTKNDGYQAFIKTWPIYKVPVSIGLLFISISLVWSELAKRR